VARSESITTRANRRRFQYVHAVLSYCLRRLVQSVIIMAGLTLLTFWMLHLLPGGMAAAILGPRISKADKLAFIHTNGLDQPIWQQYVTYLNHLVHGNLGYSYHLNQSVAGLLGSDLPKSLILVGTSTLLSLVIGVPLGLFQAVRRNKWDDHVATGASYVLYAMPDFWLGLVLIDIFALRLHVLPPVAPSGASWTAAFHDPKGMILPITTLTLISIALFSRYMRSAALDNLGQDFIRTARAKGASQGRVLWSHTVRNAAMPIITLLGLSLPGLFGGAIITETVFNYPGIGLASFSAAIARDYPVLLGTTLLFGFLTILGNLLADLAYAFLDPRVRYS
jgi:peptide/nickel transport system permease protein